MGRIKVERAIDGLTEWQKHVQTNSDIDRDISTAIEALKAQHSLESTTKGTTSDLISRQAAIDALMAAIDDVGILDGADIKVVFDNLPPAQPEPKEGHWIRRDCGLDVECKCSRCGYKDFVEPRDEYWFKRNYCPNCGAKMKGERQK